MVGLAQTSTKSKTAAKLKCVVGGKECLYEDRNSLINGDITQFAQTQFNEHPAVELPSDDFNVMVDSKTDEEPNAIDQILNQKLQSDIEAQAVQTGQQVVTQPTAPVSKAPILAIAAQIPQVDEKKLDEQAKAIALANIEAAQKKAELEREVKEQAEQASLIAQQKAAQLAEKKAQEAAMAKANQAAAAAAAQAQLQEQQREMASKKAAAIARAKANLASKLAQAQDKRKKEILIEEASVEAKEMAKEQA